MSSATRGTVSAGLNPSAMRPDVSQFPRGHGRAARIDAVGRDRCARGRRHSREGPPRCRGPDDVDGDGAPRAHLTGLVVQAVWILASPDLWPRPGVADRRRGRGPSLLTWACCSSCSTGARLVSAAGSGTPTWRRSPPRSSRRLPRPRPRVHGTRPTRSRCCAPASSAPSSRCGSRSSWSGCSRSLTLDPVLDYSRAVSPLGAPGLRRGGVRGRHRRLHHRGPARTRGQCARVDDDTARRDEIERRAADGRRRRAGHAPTGTAAARDGAQHADGDRPRGTGGHPAAGSVLEQRCHEAIDVLSDLESGAQALEPTITVSRPRVRRR